MIDIKLIRENRELVKENIKKKFQDDKLPLVDEVYEMDIRVRETQTKGDNLKAEKNKMSGEIGKLMKDKKIDEANKIKEEVSKMAEEIVALEKEQEELNKEIRDRMLVIPNIIDDSVPIGKDDSENVEVERFGEPVVPDYEIPYHADIIEALKGMDKASAGRTSGEGFYYLLGDIARLHEANEDLYLIGTSEHSMIGKFKDQIIKKEDLPINMTSYSPCFRKEGGSHGLEERGLYRVHQFEKQEMIVVCEPEESMDWYNKMWKFTVEIFRNMDIPVRQLECCSGDLADLKVKSCDIEAWSPRQKKYFEVASCSNLGDAQARRLGIRAKGDKGTYFLHTLNNTVVASPRGLIALIENNYQEDGSINVPKVLQPYMGGKKKITIK